MSLPSPSLSTPALSVDQMSFQSLTIGNGTVFGITKLENLDKADVRSGNTDRPRTRGSFVGLNLLKSRTITVTLDIGPFASNFGGYGTLASALAALRTATSTEGTTEYPLWIQLPNAPLVCCMARVLKKNVPYDITADIGSLVRGAAIQFEATDPYFYSAPTASTSLSLPTPGVGFGFPITFPLSFGGGTGGNQATITNSGDVPCWPVFVINGPCLNPSVQSLTVSGSPTLAFNIQLNAGDQLVVDCDQQSVLYYPSGQTVGAPYPQILNAGSSFWSLIPGSNSITLNSQDTSQVSGTCAIWNASAYSTLL